MRLRQILSPLTLRGRCIGSIDHLEDGEENAAKAMAAAVGKIHKMMIQIILEKKEKVLLTMAVQT